MVGLTFFLNLGHFQAYDLKEISTNFSLHPHYISDSHPLPLYYLRVQMKIQVSCGLPISLAYLASLW